MNTYNSETCQLVNYDVIVYDDIGIEVSYTPDIPRGNSETRKEQVRSDPVHQILKKADLDVCGLLGQIFAVPRRFVCQNGQQKAA